jgi:IPT/TIG domain-containing protein
MTNKPQLGIVLIWIVLAVADCTTPAAPSQIPPPAPPAPPPVQPTVTAISPNISSTAGGAWGTIHGAQFQSGVTVRLGGVLQGALFRDDATILFWTSSHPAGTVDVVVTNPGGLSGTLAGAYTFAPPDSFDFNGDWAAHAGPEYETDMRFAIRNNALVSLVCGSSEAVTLAPPPSVHGGEFSFLGDDGIAISAQLVSPVSAIGTINVPGCTTTSWWADKSDAIQSAGAR